jgi:hypothetical protein
MSLQSEREFELIYNIFPSINKYVCMYVCMYVCIDSVLYVVKHVNF